MTVSAHMAASAMKSVMKRWRIGLVPFGGCDGGVDLAA